MANNFQSFVQAINPFYKGTVADAKKDMSRLISPVQLQRLRQDAVSWRESLQEAENAWYPHRVRMQKLFIDTKLNGHVSACMERRKDLTILRKFELLGLDGKTDAQAAAIFCDIKMKDDEQILTPKKWISDFISYSLDAIFFGYTLISLGDIENDSFEKLGIVRRWNVSPDRMNVTTLTYSIYGQPFAEEPYKDWQIYVDTVNDIGNSPCGFGLLYTVGIYEIFLRNLMGFNGDFLEMFAQPYRVGKTMKTEENERAQFEEAIRMMGSAGYAIIDPTDEISFLEASTAGTAYKGYADLEMRCEKKISKMILGHSDAMDSIPGKLGASSGLETPVHQALNDKQSKDGIFVENIINKELIPRLITLGFNMPEGVTFSFKNDSEQQEIRERDDVSNQATALIFKTIKDAGGEPDWDYFSKRTGIATSKAAVPPPIVKTAPTFAPKTIDKLKNLYK